MMKRDLHQDGGLAIPSATFYTLRACGQLDPVLMLAPVSLDAARSETHETCTLQELLPAPQLHLLAESVAIEENQRIHSQVEALLASLPARQQRVLRLRYGLDVQDGRTLDRQEIAASRSFTLTGTMSSNAEQICISEGSHTGTVR